MSTKITITADASQAQQEIKAVSGGLDHLQQDAVDAANRAADALERMEDALADVASQSKETGDTVKKGIGGSDVAQAVTAVSTGFLAVTKALQGVWRAAGDAWRGIEFLAEQGNPAAQRMKSAFDDLLGSLRTLAEDPAIQDFGDKITEGTRAAVQELELLPTTYRKFTDIVTTQILDVAHAWGIVSDTAVQSHQLDMQLHERQLEAGRAEVAVEKEKLEVQRQQQELQKTLSEFDSQVAAEKRQEALAEIKDAETLTKMLAEQRQAMSDAAAGGKLDDAARADGLRKLIELQQRLRTLQQEQAAEAKRLADEEKKRREDRDKEAKAEKDRQIAEELAANQRKLDELDKQEQEALQRRQKGFEGSGLAEGINAAASDPAAVAKRLAQQRADAARNELYKGGEQDSDKLDAAAQAAYRKAFRDAMIQARGGKQQTFSQDEIASAVEQNAGAQIQQMAQQGRFSNQALQALSQAASEQRRQSQELQAMQEQLAQIQAFQNGTTQDGERRRAQRGSNRQ